MLSETQLKEKQFKIEKVVYLFLNHPNLSMKEISEMTGISSSSVQRYLNDDYVKLLVGTSIANEIKERLSNNKYEGKQKGGTVSTSKYQTPRDTKGKFVSKDVVEQHQIEKITLYGLTNKLSLNELSKVFHISVEELRASMNELLPILNSELYNLAYDCYHLNDMIETLKFEQSGWKSK